jgi:hypothetical protein
VANPNKGRRARSRKRRSGVSARPRESAEREPLAGTKPESLADPREGAAKPGRVAASRTARAPRTRARAVPRGRGVSGDPRGDARGILGGTLAVGERPQAPWHPLPLSELLILVGAIGAVVGLSRGESHGGPALFAGLAAVVLGTGEVTLREHLSGYRSHALLLSLLPVIALDTALAFAAAAFITPVPVGLKVAVLGLDLPLLAVLFKLLRARFLDARRERVFAGRR